MFRKIKERWMNMDKFLVTLIATIAVVIISVTQSDIIVKTVYSVVGVTIFMGILNNIANDRQNNILFDVEVYIEEQFSSGILWKIEDSALQENLSYLNIVNTGEVKIHGLCLKVIKNDGAVGKYIINEMVSNENSIYVQIPFKRESIKEIVAICLLRTESRTKKFYGKISGNRERYLFSKTEKSMGEKLTLSEFVKMERIYY